MAVDSKDISEIVKKCQILLLDIEGTTTSISFVKDKLFPYAEENVKQFLESKWDSDEVKKAVEGLRELARDDVKKNTEPNDAMNVPGEKDSKVDQIEGLVKNVKWLMSSDRKVTALKEMQGLIWKNGYDNGDLKGHVFDDVSPALEQWRSMEGHKVYIYSSGSVLAQKLLFGKSLAGDMTGLIDGYFDTEIGGKCNSSSYTAISEKIEVKPQKILFLTDKYDEAVAARKAGMYVAIVSREGNDPLSSAATDEYAVVHSFAQLAVSNKRKTEPQDEQPAKIPKTDTDGDVKTTSEPALDKPAIEPAKEEQESMEVDETPIIEEKMVEGKEIKTTVKQAAGETVIEDVTESVEPVDVPMVDIEPVTREESDKSKNETKIETNDAEPAATVKPDVVVTKSEEVVTKLEEVVTTAENVSNKTEDVVSRPEETTAKPEEIVTKADEVVKKPDEVVTKPDEISSKSEEVLNKPDEAVNKPDEATKATEISQTSEIKDIVQEATTTDDNESKSNEAMEKEESVKEPEKEKIETETVKEKAKVAEETPPAIITEIEEITAENLEDMSEMIEDIEPVVEEPANEDMEDLQNVGEVLEKECDEILSKVQDVTNLDNIPLKPLLNPIAEEAMETEIDAENIDSNDIVDRILDTELELEMKQCNDIDLNTVSEITDDTKTDETLEIEITDDKKSEMETITQPEEKVTENNKDVSSEPESMITENTDKMDVKDEEKAENKENVGKSDQVESNKIESSDKNENNDKEAIKNEDESKITVDKEDKVVSSEKVDNKEEIESNVKEENEDTKEKSDKTENTDKMETDKIEETQTPIVEESKDKSAETSKDEVKAQAALTDTEMVVEETKTDNDKDKDKESQVNGKATNGDAETVNVNGDSSKVDELSSRLSVENGEEPVNGSKNVVADSEKGQGDKAEAEVSDIKVKSVATEEPRTDPIEQPTEA